MTRDTGFAIAVTERRLQHEPQSRHVRRQQRFDAVEGGSAACDGVVRFDGATTDHYLSGHCISMDIAADGSVWVLADEEEGGDLYVINPEAVAATE